MTDKRWLYFALGVTTALSLGAVTNQLVPLTTTGVALSDQGIIFPDGTVQTTAAPRDSRLAFYLTKTQQTGGSADSACASGFHFASIWEIQDVSNLRYDGARGVRYADSGAGPPTNRWGWVRTGKGAIVSDTPGAANCTNPILDAPWTSSLAHHDGTVVILTNNDDDYATHPRVPDPWRVSAGACINTNASWCVEEYPGAGG